MRDKINSLTLIAIFGALMCIVSPFSLPLGPVSVSLATFVIYIVSYCANTFSAFMTVVIYIVLGIVGLPVFSGFCGGIGHIFSYTGGFILGYIPMVLIISPLSKINRKAYLLSMILSTLILYSVGCIWYSYYSSTEIIASVYVCVLPFVIGDIAKISAAMLISEKLKNLQTPFFVLKCCG